jgi:hypothetical protein
MYILYFCFQILASDTLVMTRILPSQSCEELDGWACTNLVWNLTSHFWKEKDKLDLVILLLKSDKSIVPDPSFAESG